MSSWILVRSVSARICSLLIRCGECTNLSRSSRTDVYYTPSLPKKIREWPRTSPERAIIKWAQEYLEISSFAHELLIFSYRLWLDGAPSYFFWQTTVTLNIDRKKIRRIPQFPFENKEWTDLKSSSPKPTFRKISSEYVPFCVFYVHSGVLEHS